VMASWFTKQCWQSPRSPLSSSRQCRSSRHILHLLLESEDSFHRLGLVW